MVLATEIKTSRQQVKPQKDFATMARLFDDLAPQYDFWKNKNYYFYQEIERFYKSIIPEGKNVLEISTADGYILNSLKPAHGVGLSMSARMAEKAKEKYQHLNFINTTIEDYKAEAQFDYVVIYNFLEYVFDLFDFCSTLHAKVSSGTKIMLTCINPLWRPIMGFAARFKMRAPIEMKNFVTYRDVENIVSVSGFEVIESGYRMFLPIKIPFISHFLNKLIPRLPFLRHLCLVQYIIARPKQNSTIDRSLSCSVVIPCHNEEGNIEECINRVPELGDYTEILIVDDGSTDNTANIVREIQKRKDNVNLISYIPNKGKGHAVRTGFSAGKGDIQMILDADMAVLPEELTKFYNVLASHQAEFVNGSRMIYDMVPGAMKFLNYLGNKVFGIILSFIIGQRNTDTLCGTKAFYKKDYKSFKMGRCPWGDFDLLFEAAKMKLKTIEMPVHYYPRVQGESKMKAFKHGLLLLRMCWYGFWHLG